MESIGRAAQPEEACHIPLPSGARPILTDWARWTLSPPGPLMMDSGDQPESPGRDGGHGSRRERPLGLCPAFLQPAFSEGLLGAMPLAGCSHLLSLPRHSTRGGLQGHRTQARHAGLASGAQCMLMSFLLVTCQSYTP